MKLYVCKNNTGTSQKLKAVGALCKQYFNDPSLCTTVSQSPITSANEFITKQTNGICVLAGDVGFMPTLFSATGCPRQAPKCPPLARHAHKYDSFVINA